MYKSAEFDHTTATESIVNTLTTVLSVVAIGAGLTVISGGLFGFAVPGYIATAGQVAGGILTAKDIGHLITGKDINGNPLSATDKEALMGSFILDATMVGVSSLSKLKLKYANKVNKIDSIEGKAEATKKVSTNYKETFFEKHPDLRGEVIVHHSVEQQVLKKYPDIFTKEEIHAYESLRGIPNEVNSEIHLSKIRIEWNKFYKDIAKGKIEPTKENFLNKVKEIDEKFGDKFKPKIK